MRKRLLAWTLLLCLLTALLSGCGADGGGAEETATEDRSDTFYTTEYLTFDAQVDEVIDSAMDGTSIYLLGGRYLDGGDSFCLLRLPMDGGELEELPDYAPVSPPEGTEGVTCAMGLYVGTDGTLWVRETAFYSVYDLPEDFDPETQKKMDYLVDSGAQDVLRQLDAAGAELRRIDMTTLMDQLGVEYAGIADLSLDFALDADGNLYLLSPSVLYVLDSNLALRFSLEWEGESASLLALGSGGFAVRATQGKTCGVRAVDLEARDWGEAYPLSGEITSAWSGMGDWLFFYTGGGILYAWDAAANVETCLTVWDRERVNPRLITCCAMLPDGRIAALLDRNGKPEALVLTEADPEALPEVTALTYAVLSQDHVDWDAVNDFNRTHTDVQIEVKDYSVYDNETAVGARSGMEQLMLEMAAGRFPDIVDLGSGGSDELPYRQMAQMGYLEDLWPYIESDPDLGRESLMEAPLKAAEVNGGLYMAFNDVQIQTLVGAESVVGDRYSWSLADLQAALAAMPEGSTVMEYCFTKQDMFYYALRMSLDNYVDWETGDCSFDSEAFRAALEFIDSYPASFDWGDAASVNEEIDRRLLEGTQMLSMAVMTGMGDIQVYDAVFGGRASFVGYPVEDGSAGSCFTIGKTRLGICAACRNKEAAWKFVRSVFLPHDEMALGIQLPVETEGPEEANARIKVPDIPVNRVDFERKKEAAMRQQTEEDPVPYNSYTVPFGSAWIEIHPVTEEEAGRFMDFFHSVEKIFICDQTVYSIVQELCTPFFAGDRTLDETIRLIQNQVGLYVMEQAS